MRRIALLMVLLIGLAVTSAARSQQPTAKAPSKSSSQAADSVLLKPSPELQKSLDDLAAAVQALVSRIANDPQVKTAAMQVATGAVTTAQQVVAEQSVNIEAILKTAAERISAAQSNIEHSKKK